MASDFWKVRNVPAPWEYEKERLLALICQNGLPDLFLTFSGIELKWPDLIKILAKTVDKINTSLEEIHSMEYGVRACLIREDPVTCTFYFSHCFHQLMRTWKGKNGPFGNHRINHFCYRINCSTEVAPMSMCWYGFIMLPYSRIQHP